VTTAAPGAAPDPAVTGERIERLLEASAASGPIAAERAEELVRLVVELYGAGLERLMELAYESGALTDELLDSLAADELVSGLLLVHGLHPYGVEERVEKALESVRPYFESHGGDMRLVEVTQEGDQAIVRLQSIGSCDGCASSSATLELTVEDAIRAAAPEVVRIHLESAPQESAPEATVSNLIPVDQLTARLHAGTPA
jgi:Fe-S cluster biogenesis protein NfuA